MARYFVQATVEITIEASVDIEEEENSPPVNSIIEPLIANSISCRLEGNFDVVDVTIDSIEKEEE